jgi:hypothetical protein
MALYVRTVRTYYAIIRASTARPCTYVPVPVHTNRALGETIYKTVKERVGAYQTCRTCDGAIPRPRPRAIPTGANRSHPSNRIQVERLIERLKIP